MMARHSPPSNANLASVHASPPMALTEWVSPSKAQIETVLPERIFAIILLPGFFRPRAGTFITTESVMNTAPFAFRGFFNAHGHQVGDISLSPVDRFARHRNCSQNERLFLSGDSRLLLPQFFGWWLLVVIGPKYCRNLRLWSFASPIRFFLANCAKRFQNAEWSVPCIRDRPFRLGSHSVNLPPNSETTPLCRPGFPQILVLVDHPQGTDSLGGTPGPPLCE